MRELLKGEQCKKKHKAQTNAKKPIKAQFTGHPTKEMAKTTISDEENNPKIRESGKLAVPG